MNMTISEPRTISRQQRRHLERQAAKRAERPGPNTVTSAGSNGVSTRPDAPLLSHQRLSMPALDKLVATLKGYGNKLTDHHIMALAALMGAMTNMVTGELKGRWAYGLPTGMGKTSAIVAWCAQLTKLGLDDVSVAVSASKVEALCDLKRAMEDAGVPADRIGLVHAKRFDPDKAAAILAGNITLATHYASEPSEGHDRQIMLVTHQRVRGCSTETFNLYHGKPRDLLLYDETLLVSDSVGIPLNFLNGALASMVAISGNTAKYQPLIEYVTVAMKSIKDVLDGEDRDVVITLPELAPVELEDFKKLADKLSQYEHVRQFLNIVDHDIRVVGNEQGGVLWYSVVVPPEIENIIILDASAPIRKLARLDPTITDVEHPTKGLDEIRRIGVKKLADLKSFENVTIRQMVAGGGRSTVEATWRMDRAEDRKHAREVIDVVRNIPLDEAVLIFVYKTGRAKNAPNCRATLLSDLEDAGVDINAMIDGEPRINVATWGMETNLNRYGHCSNVILAGVLQRDPISLAAEYVGQIDDLKREVSKETIAAIHLSELCHCVYQAFSRGACRFIDGGKARKMNGWFIDKDNIKPELDKVMVGAKWLPWRSTAGVNVRKIAGLVQEIAAHLDGLPETVTKVSIMKVKASMVDVLKDTPTQTWKHALHRYLDDGPPWRLVKSSLERWSETFSQVAE